eukprot:GHVS01030803.1.p3 GENE.GHVS01030803.1~~GHVS01030803.1.p3  ORF type:complete len:111 (-),score=29.06 GHVS01030803.1:863-1195(-)
MTAEGVRIGGEGVHLVTAVGVRLRGEGVHLMTAEGVRMGGEGVHLMTAEGVRIGGEGVHLMTAAAYPREQARGHDDGDGGLSPRQIDRLSLSVLILWPLFCMQKQLFQTT